MLTKVPASAHQLANAQTSGWPLLDALETARTAQYAAGLAGTYGRPCVRAEAAPGAGCSRMGQTMTAPPHPSASAHTEGTRSGSACTTMPPPVSIAPYKVVHSHKQNCRTSHTLAKRPVRPQAPVIDGLHVHKLHYRQPASLGILTLPQVQGSIVRCAHWPCALPCQLTRKLE